MRPSCRLNMVLYLISKTLHIDVIHSLEMRVKGVDDSQRNLQQILDDEAERHVVGEANLITDGNQPSITCQRHHFNR